ncbi:MAG: YggS family pyridoxal phosphate-dependent enzyme [Candidatus Theseobacter exili]|nr:YggS family pyridoxal phosphate-dependent enzyme [Candidatus Theseobacter exili]
MGIRENYLKIREEIPDYVEIVLASKTRTKKEIEEVISAGAKNIGENYVQEAENMYSSLGKDAEKVQWHMIGSLQKNKINKALKIFDYFQTVDSFHIAEALNTRAGQINKIIPVFVEVNIGSEITKSGVKPDFEKIKNMAVKISELTFLRLEGLMTMGPRTGDPQKIRPYFRKTKEIFDRLSAVVIPNVSLKYLSMGMSNSYKVAIEEGANMVRLGTIVFGKRSCALDNSEEVNEC